jgi:anti-sigma factor RsiW
MGRLWRRSAARLRQRFQPRTEPERPRVTLGTLPFMLLILALMGLAVAIIIAAVPGRKYPEQKAEPAEVGTAPPGWLGD